MTTIGPDSVSDTEISRIVSLGGPVLCSDTCTVLDLMRDPTRENVLAHERQAALDLLAEMEVGPNLIGLLADQVVFEFRENANTVESEAREALERLKHKLQRLDTVAAVYGGSGSASINHLDGHVAQARAIVDRWVRASIQVEQGSDIASRAFLRLNQVRTPARRGKDSMKDCVVVETYIDFVAQLRMAGLISPIVFVSSNVKDYTEETRTVLKADLFAEFTRLNLMFAPNFAAAKHQLRLR